MPNKFKQTISSIDAFVLTSYTGGNRTIRWQTNSWSVKSWTGQLAE